MSLVLSVIIGIVVVLFAVMAFAPLLLLVEQPTEKKQPVLTVFKGGKSTTFKDAA